ncbi:MAG TPA: AI-2E family transporter [Cytophagales bacterium]|nr:AI-2E family transporter [Cytophagales bacterium]
MQTTTLKNINSKLLFVVLTCVILYFGKPLLIPVVFSMLLAMLMTPVSNKLEEKGMSRVSSSILSILIVILVLGGILALIIMQGVNLSDDLPGIQKKIQEYAKQIENYIQQQFNVSSTQISSFIKKQSQSMGQSGGKFVGKFLQGFTSTLVSIVLVFVFMFLFLLKRDRYEAFFLKLYSGNNPDEIREMIFKISKVSQHYLQGRVLSILILTVLYFAGIAALGVKNAFLLSIIAALATVVPYVGTIIGSLFPFAMAIISGSFSSALGVLVVIFIIQTLDNYFIEPYIVGGEVSISPFFTIFGLFAGGLIWGVAGVILFLPLMGIMKIVFDHVKDLHPYAYLISDEKSESKAKKIFLKLVDKIKK